MGESSGTLSQNLLYLADEIKKDKELKSKVRAALIYPMVLLTATIAVVGFLTFFVFPKILPVLSGFNVELPATTRMLIAILDFSKAYGVISVIILFFLLLVGRYVYRSVRPIRYFIHRNLLRAPVLGTLIQYVNIANFSRILGLLLKSGVHIVEAINITSTTFSNLVYCDAFAGSAEAIRRGESLATYLDKQPKIFPSLLVGIVSIGETTGNLEENLTYLAGHYMEETDEALKTLTTLLEPLLLVGMGLVVGFVALSIILPIYSLSQGVG